MPDARTTDVRNSKRVRSVKNAPQRSARAHTHRGRVFVHHPTTRIEPRWATASEKGGATKCCSEAEEQKRRSRWSRTCPVRGKTGIGALHSTAQHYLWPSDTQPPAVSTSPAPSKQSKQQSSSLLRTPAQYARQPAACRRRTYRRCYPTDLQSVEAAASLL